MASAVGPMSALLVFIASSVPSINSVSVYEDATGDNKASWDVLEKVSWGLLAESGCKRLSGLTYGNAPVGFAAGQPAALEEGKVYRVEVDGCGVTGVEYFKIINGRAQIIPQSPGV